MTHVVFVAPLFREATVRYLRAFLELEGARVSTVGQDPVEALDPALRARLVGHVRAPASLDADPLTEAVREVARRYGKVDCVVGHLEQLQIPLGQVRDRLGIAGMGEATARNFRDKSRMKDLLGAAGVPVARHRLCGSVAEVRRFADEVGWPVVVKPPDGLGARATYRLADPDALAAFDRLHAPSVDDPVQVEELVDVAEENTCETVSVDGRSVWRSGTRYLPKVLEVVENPWMQYCVVLPRETDDARANAIAPHDEAALRALGQQTGLTHLEWFRGRDGRVIVSEVGARPPGASIMPLMAHAHEFDPWAAWAGLMTHGRFTPPTRRWAAGVAFFRGVGSGRVAAVDGLAQAQAEVGPWVVEQHLPRIGQPKASGYEGEGWAIVRHAETRVVIEALHRLVSLVRVSYA